MYLSKSINFSIKIKVFNPKLQYFEELSIFCYIIHNAYKDNYALIV